jgi:lipoprotein-anchoring transpeptidase ErfK/SrfK
VGVTRRRGWYALLAAALLAGTGAYAHTAGAPAGTGQQLSQLRAADAHVDLGGSSAARGTTPAKTPAKKSAAKKSAKKTPAVNHCAHNHRRQLVLVSITEQHAWFCARSRTVYSTAVTTGRSGKDTRTPTGHFTVQGRDRDTVLLPDDGRRYHVRYWIPFDAPTYGFHDASWQTFPFGSAKYRTGGSQGCVHLPLRTITFLYHWVHIGASVTIRA